MRHPEIVLVPIFMFTDYFLTILGATLKERKYNNHFKTPYYELNPVWQKAISRKKWFNPRHILMCVALVWGVLAWVAEFGHTPEPYVEALLGFFFVAYGMVIGAHLSNILTFRHVARRPEEISGQVTMAHSLSLSLSTYRYLMVVLPLAMVAIFSPTPFVLGGFGGVGWILLVHCGWIRRHRKKASHGPGTGDGK